MNLGGTDFGHTYEQAYADYDMSQRLFYQSQANAAAMMTDPSQFYVSKPTDNFQSLSVDSAAFEKAQQPVKKVSLVEQCLAKDIKVDGLLARATDIINQSFAPKAAVPALSNYQKLVKAMQPSAMLRSESSDSSFEAATPTMTTGDLLLRSFQEVSMAGLKVFLGHESKRHDLLPVLSSMLLALREEPSCQDSDVSMDISAQLGTPEKRREQLSGHECSTDTNFKQSPLDPFAENSLSVTSAKFEPKHKKLLDLLSYSQEDSRQPGQDTCAKAPLYTQLGMLLSADGAGKRSWQQLPLHRIDDDVSFLAISWQNLKAPGSRDYGNILAYYRFGPGELKLLGVVLDQEDDHFWHSSLESKAEEIAARTGIQHFIEWQRAKLEQGGLPHCDGHQEYRRSMQRHFQS